MVFHFNVFYVCIIIIFQLEIIRVIILASWVHFYVFSDQFLRRKVVQIIYAMTYKRFINC